MKNGAVTYVTAPFLDLPKRATKGRDLRLARMTNNCVLQLFVILGNAHTQTALSHTLF